MSRITLFRVAALVLVAVGAVGCERKLSDPKPDTVVVTLSPSEISADDGGSLATALVTEKRTPLKGFAVSFQIALTADSGANPSYAAMTAVTDVNGRASVLLSGLNVAGEGSVTATAVKDSGEPITRGDVPVSGSTPVSVRAGSPTLLDAELSATSVDLANVDSIDVSYLVRDAQGNLTNDPVEIVTDHPGATVLAATIANLGAAGNWSVSVSVVGNPAVSDTESFQVLPSAGAIIDTFLSNSTTDAYADPALHPPVVVGYQVTDGSGNDVTADSNVICTISGLSGGAVEAGTLRIFPLVVKGTFSVTCSLLDAALALVDADAETVVVLDLTPPTVIITSPAANTHFASGANVDVTVNAQDLVGVVSMGSQVVGLGGNSATSELVTGNGALNKNVTKTFSLQAANADFFGGTQTVFAYAQDGSGNVANASSVPIIIDPFAVMPTGIAVALVREDAAFANPNAIAADPSALAATPRLFLADNGGGGAIWKIDYTRATGVSTMTAVNTGWAANGVEFNAAGTLLFAPRANQVRVFNWNGTTLTVNRTLTNAAANVLVHAVFGPTSPTSCPTGPCLYLTDPANSEVWLLDTSTDAFSLFADNNTARNGGGPAMDRPTGIAFDSATNRLFVSDGFLGGGANDVVYELAPDGADALAITESLSVFMNNTPALGPTPDLPYGMEYRGLGGTGIYANRVFAANLGNDQMYEAARDGGDAGLLSDDWNTFVEALGRAPIDMAFQPGSDQMYVLFSNGNGMDPHVVELSGF